MLAMGWEADVKILPVAQRWGGGPPPQAVVEGRNGSVKSPSVSASRCHLPMASPQGGSKVRNRSLAAISTSSSRTGSGIHNSVEVMASGSSQG